MPDAFRKWILWYNWGMKRILCVVAGALALFDAYGRAEVKASEYGFDAADSTRFIQTAIDSGAAKVILDRQASPWVVTPLKGRSGLTLVLERGVELVAKEGAFESPQDTLLSFSCATNVAVCGHGATIRMRRADYLKPPYLRGEWRHALSFIDCRRVTVEGVRIEEAGGDGIYLGSRNRKADGACVDVTVRDVVCDGSLRQGISVISAENLLIERTKLLNTRGLPPEAGIDFEPNQTWQRFVNCVMRDCEMNGNKGEGVVVALHHLNQKSRPIGIRLENCRMRGNVSGFRLLQNAALDGGSARGGVSLSGCVLADSRNSGLSVTQNFDDGVKLSLSGCRLSGNCTVMPWLADVTFMSRSRLDDPPGGVDLGDLRVEQPVEREWVWYCDAGWNAKPVTTVKGEVTVSNPKGERRVRLDDDWRRSFAPPRAVGPVHAPFSPADATVTDLEKGKMLKLQPATLRGKADYVFYAAAPGKVRFMGTVRNLRRRSAPPTPISVKSLAGKWSVSMDYPATGEFAIDVPAAGFYSLNVKLSPRQTFTLAACDAPVAIALLDDNAQSLFNHVCSLHFAVPSGGAFAFHAAGQGFSERVGVTLYDPSGARAAEDGKVLNWRRFAPPKPAAGLWRVSLSKPSEGTLEDYCIDLTGIPAFLFPSDRRYWTCAAAEVPPPAPPPKQEWGFVRELSTPPERAVRERFRLSDGYGCGDALRTALDDLADFLGGGRELRLARGKVDGRESYRIEASPDRVTLTAEDDEGMRRAIYRFEDRVQAGDLKDETRRPWLRHRFSRCFFAPTKRPPLYTDELMDDVDYYPDAYLNRLAHEGVNALWITVTFRDLAATSFTERSPDADRRLAKLAATAAKLKRYGIGLWLFAIEPRRVVAGDAFLKRRPDLFRRVPGGNVFTMCPSEPDTLRYLEETASDIFTRVPDLAGHVNISHGERATTCLSNLSATGPGKYSPWMNGRDPCAKCDAAEPWRLHSAVCSALVRGMRKGNPEAELFSWYYQPYPQPQREQWVKDVASHMPDGVTFVYNFESGALMKQAGRMREGGDYWLAYAGPSGAFREIAAASRSGGGRLAAKLQTGCGYEMATVPFVPVPGILYRKYREMKALGVGSVMQCWLVGNYPGTQNAAAGELAFEDFADGEDAFLERLAAPEWGGLAPKVASMWKAFSDAYSCYPLSNDMQYYGPFNEGVNWRLFADVEMKPINPSWKPDFPPSGDTIGEALENHTIEEALMLMERMCDLPDPRELPAATREQRLDRGLMRAVQLHFLSGYRIFRFYWLRREAVVASRERGDFAAARKAVDGMSEIVRGEVETSREMRALSAEDSRLGFHSEAERHKYFPAMFDWRIDRLGETAARLAEIRAELAAGRPYPESALERSAPRCAVNGPAMSGGGLEWRLSGGEDSLTVSGRCSPGGDGDKVEISFFDATGTAFPDNYTITRAGIEPYFLVRSPDDTRAACRIEPAADGGWRFTLTLSAWKWGRDLRVRPAWIYVRRPSTGYVWPEERNGPPRHRLNLFSIQGNHFGRISWR